MFTIIQRNHRVGGYNDHFKFIFTHKNTYVKRETTVEEKESVGVVSLAQVQEPFSFVSEA